MSSPERIELGAHRQVDLPKINLPSMNSTVQSTWKTYYNKTVTWLNPITSHPIAQSLPPLFDTLAYITEIFKTAIKSISSVTKIGTLTSDLGELSKVGVVALLAVPFAIYGFGKSIKGLIDTRHASDVKNVLIDASLVTAVAIGVLLEAPGKIASVIELFSPIVTHVATWAPFLGVVASALSVFNLVIHARSYQASRDLLNELEEESVRAFLTELKYAPRDPNLDEDFFKSLDFINADHFYAELENNFSPIDRGLDIVSAKKYIDSIQAQLRSVEPNALLKQLTAAADAALVACLQSRDEAFLSKHFSVDGTEINETLKNITETYRNKIDSEKEGILNNEIELSSAEYISRAASNLKGRIKVKMLSDAAMIVVSVISTIASATLVTAAFVGAVATPAAIVAYGLIIAISAFVIAKLYIDYKRRQDFEIAMDMNQKEIEPAPIIKVQFDPEEI